MVGLLIVVSVLLLLMNIKLMMSRKLMIEEESDRLEAAMAEFVEAVEKENDALYEKLTARLQVAEAKMERISKLEQATPKPQAAEQVEEPAAATFVSKPEGTSRREQIRQLMKQGFSAAHIAKLLNLNIGETEVAVQIEKKRQI